MKNKKHQISQTVLDALALASIDGNKVFLHGELSRTVYLETNAVLAACGGKWDRKQKCHLFKSDPSLMLIEAITSGEVATNATFQFFPTPPEIVQRMLEPLGDLEGLRVLEPSAGDGAIAKALVARRAEVTAVEFDERRIKSLRDCVGTEATIVHRDFLAFARETHLRWDAIVMNPPFSQQQDIDHVEAALDLLAPSGKLSAIMSAGISFRGNKKAQQFRERILSDGSITPLPPGSFRSSGTEANTVLVTFH